MFNELSLNRFLKVFCPMIVFLFIVFTWNTASQGNDIHFPIFPKALGTSSRMPLSARQSCSADHPIIQMGGSCRVDDNLLGDSQSFSSSKRKE
jgi:hypothetical protein